MLECATALENGDFDRAHALTPEAAGLHVQATAWANIAADPLFDEVEVAA